MANKKLFVANAETIELTTSKVNFFNAKREFSDKVVAIYTFDTHVTTKKSRTNKKIKSLQEDIQKLHELKDSYAKGTVKATSIKEDEIPQRILDKQAEIVALNKKLASDIEKLQEKYPEYDVADENLALAYKNYINGDISVDLYDRAFMEFFHAIGMQVNAQFLQEMKSVFGKKKASARTIVNSGNTVLTCAMSKTAFIKLLYAELAQRMMQAGTIKAIQFPQDVIKMYAPKKPTAKKATSKKASK